MAEGAAEINEEVREQRDPVDLAIRGIIRQDKDLFFPPSDFDAIRIRDVYSSRTVPILHGGNFDLQNGQRLSAEVRRIRSSDNDWVPDELEFLLADHTLIPLGTHSSQTQGKFKVYELDDSLRNVLRTKELDDYILEHLPDNVILTRVLSEKEADKFATAQADIGSSAGSLWADTVHTALHNVSNEFEQHKGYSKVIKMKMQKLELAKLLKSGKAHIGNYNFLFRNRDPNSPLPFDSEVVFGKKSLPALLGAYQRWRAETGVPYVDSPFQKVAA